MGIMENEFGDLIEVNEFIQMCCLGGFIDYDGYGYPATETHHDSDDRIYPSMVTNKEYIFKPEYPFVLWFNR